MITEASTQIMWGSYKFFKDFHRFMAEYLNIHWKDLYDSVNSHRRVFQNILSSFIRHSHVIDWKKNEKIKDER